MDSIFSNDGNVMLAAIVSVLFVIILVLLLHVYAKWFLYHANQRRNRSSMTLSTVLGPNRFHHHFPTLAFDITNISTIPTKGLDPSIISSIPLFVCKVQENKHGLECVICLTGFEENEIGRNLPKCGHSFHVECIDMWFSSHSTCPICRTPVVCEGNNGNSTEVGEYGAGINGNPDSVIVIDVMDSVDNVENLMVNDSSLLGHSSFACSLKRMFSQSWSENRVFPASSVLNNEVVA